jgi:ribosome biogenesis SPOUT family RNA methylase Rps3
MKFIIELREKRISKWLQLEIEHSSLIVGKENLVLTNVRYKSHMRVLKKYGKVLRDSIIDLKELHDKIIILDPKAKEVLKPDEAKEAILVIGGIMGDFPPRGRTFKYITSKLKNVRARNIGKHQFSIDGAIFVAKMIAEGKKLEEIPYVKKISIQVDPFHEIILPFAYPLVNGKPLIYDKLVEYLKMEIEKDEEELIMKSMQK